MATETGATETGATETGATETVAAAARGVNAAAQAATLLDVRGLHAGYGETKVLHGLDFVVDTGGVTTLLGANGAGKTTTLRAISGMVRTSGDIVFAGNRINGAATEAIARAGIAHVPDGRGTFMELTVEENLRLGAYTRRDRGVQADFERMFGYFPKLQQRFRQQAGTLSGGEQQMLAIARALLLRPKLLLLDEPSFGLAPLIVREIFAIMREVIQKEGTSILVVEQNAALALAIADRAYLLETGRIVMSGAAADIRRDEAVRRSYLGY
jgi:branched-chain amino acid transport system ATP-binding protein